MRKIICIFLLLMSGISAMDAQDIILLKTGEEVEAKVTDVSDTEIKYKKFSNQSGPAYVMLVSEIFMIKYENGDKDVFGIDTPDDETENVKASESDADYAVLYVYRQSKTGTAVKYDLHLGDTVICKVKNNWKETVKITQEGQNTLWAKTESTVELPIDIEFGKEYYVRCSIKMGAFVGRPKLELVDNEKGEAEYEAIQEKKK